LSCWCLFRHVPSTIGDRNRSDKIPRRCAPRNDRGERNDIGGCHFMSFISCGR
jgi:hypothetical protein